VRLLFIMPLKFEVLSCTQVSGHKFKHLKLYNSIRNRKWTKIN
jgi:hypothetical protein